MNAHFKTKISDFSLSGVCSFLKIWSRLAFLPNFMLLIVAGLSDWLLKNIPQGDYIPIFFFRLIPINPHQKKNQSSEGKTIPSAVRSGKVHSHWSERVANTEEREVALPPDCWPLSFSLTLSIFLFFSRSPSSTWWARIKYVGGCRLILASDSSIITFKSLELFKKGPSTLSSSYVLILKGRVSTHTLYHLHVLYTVTVMDNLNLFNDQYTSNVLNLHKCL